MKEQLLAQLKALALEAKAEADAGNPEAAALGVILFASVGSVLSGQHILMARKGKELSDEARSVATRMLECKGGE